MKKGRPRSERRRAEREAAKLGDAREKLARLSPGGAPERAIDVSSAAIVESEATAVGCARCGGEVRVEEHDAVEGLRRVRTRCKRCGARREVWLRVASRLLS
jgi:DNA-directed RNA polymerase subunit RPC12/RpoP